MAAKLYQPNQSLKIQSISMLASGGDRNQAELSDEMENLRMLHPGDLDQVAAVYHDAVISQTKGLYSNAQIAAWANHAHTSNGVREVLHRGYGLASCAANDSSLIEAFGVLDPVQRLSLLYCRGRSSRQGRGRLILQSLEIHAWNQGCRQLHTEASQLSKPLLLHLGWQIDTEEKVIFAGEPFKRWRMIKELNQPQEMGRDG